MSIQKNDKSNAVKERIVHVLVFIGLMVLINLGYYVTGKAIVAGKEKKQYNMEFFSENEFLKTIDCASLIDKYGIDDKYYIEFEIKTDIPGEVLVYFQNGAGARYSFYQTVDATNSYKKFSMTISPTLGNTELKEAYLAFYGGYGTGVIPSVRHVVFKKHKDN